jgi:hypothetical protein
VSRLRRSFTAAVERNASLAGAFETEPYEAGWASEARWFVRVHAIEGRAPSLTCQPQVSPDGLDWCDEESAPLVLRGPGLATLKLRDFGGWLRLRCVAHDGDAHAQPSLVKVSVYLSLKE